MSGAWWRRNAKESLKIYVREGVSLHSIVVGSSTLVVSSRVLCLYHFAQNNLILSLIPSIVFREAFTAGWVSPRFRRQHSHWLIDFTVVAKLTKNVERSGQNQRGPVRLSVGPYLVANIHLGKFHHPRWDSCPTSESLRRFLTIQLIGSSFPLASHCVRLYNRSLICIILSAVVVRFPSLPCAGIFRQRGEGKHILSSFFERILVSARDGRK